MIQDSTRGRGAHPYAGWSGGGQARGRFTRRGERFFHRWLWGAQETWADGKLTAAVEEGSGGAGEVGAASVSAPPARTDLELALAEGRDGAPSSTARRRRSALWRIAMWTLIAIIAVAITVFLIFLDEDVWMRVLCFLVFVPSFSICAAFGLRENTGRLGEITRLRRALDEAWADGRLRYAAFRTGAVSCQGFDTTVMRALFGGDESDEYSAIIADVPVAGILHDGRPFAKVCEGCLLRMNTDGLLSKVVFARGPTARRTTTSATPTTAG
ncbi:hypothetical protein [Corynebacterium frankenforstense]